MFEHCKMKIQKILLIERRAFYSCSIAKKKKKKKSKGGKQPHAFCTECLLICNIYQIRALKTEPYTYSTNLEGALSISKHFQDSIKYVLIKICSMEIKLPHLFSPVFE